MGLYSETPTCLLAAKPPASAALLSVCLYWPLERLCHVLRRETFAGRDANLEALIVVLDHRRASSHFRYTGICWSDAGLATLNAETISGSNSEWTVLPKYCSAVRRFAFGKRLSGLQEASRRLPTQVLLACKALLSIPEFASRRNFPRAAARLPG